MTATLWDPTAHVPDWVVLGRIREHLLASLPVPRDLCTSDELPLYVAALSAAGHTHSELARLMGVRADRIVTDRRTP